MPPSVIFNALRSAMLSTWAVFQYTGGQQHVSMLVACCVVHMADAVIEALSDGEKLSGRVRRHAP